MLGLFLLLLRRTSGSGSFKKLGTGLSVPVQVPHMYLILVLIWGF
jgi:hypothetical protein